MHETSALVTDISLYFQGNNFINNAHYLGIWTSLSKKTSNPISKLSEALLISERKKKQKNITQSILEGGNEIPLLSAPKQKE